MTDPRTVSDQGTPGFDPFTLTRPAPILLRYYLVIALFSTIAFPVVFLPLYFRYHTLRFRFDTEGISLSWGILFRREVHLTYRRIQDIHLTRNLLQRWMGLATVEIQTASGNAEATMKIEGVLQADALRDFLYNQMRGARHEEDTAPPVPLADEALTLLREIRDEVHALRQPTGPEVHET
jgi:putative membrane protein